MKRQTTQSRGRITAAADFAFRYLNASRRFIRDITTTIAVTLIVLFPARVLSAVTQLRRLGLLDAAIRQ